MDVVLLVLCIFIIGLISLKSLIILAGAWVLAMAYMHLFRLKYAYGAFVVLYVVAIIILRLEGLAGIGTSFLVLRCIGFMGDVHYKKVKEVKPHRVLLYLTFFPTFVMGPLMGYEEFFRSFDNRGKVNYEALSNGAFRIALGIFKKLAIADAMMVYIRGDVNLLTLLLYNIALWADFSGGCDIVIGLCSSFGIEIRENFVLPYKAGALGEFWRRWHITMADWFKRYVFYPLSINKFIRQMCRKNIKAITILTTLLTWALTGLWHGLSFNFLLWGVCNGIIILIEGKRELGIVYTYVMVAILRVFDLTKNPLEAVRSLINMPHIDISKGLILSLCMFLVYCLVIKFKHIKHRGFLVVLLLLLALVFGHYGIGFDIDAFVYGKY